MQYGGGVPLIRYCYENLNALREVGFEIVDHYDNALISPTSPVPFYLDAVRPWMVWFAYPTITAGTWLAEKLHILPAGSLEAWNMLMTMKNGIRDGGMIGIFTQLQMIVARKPDIKGLKK